ncbi:hypothetical protein [uncultured Clostridium sp.]|uniref:hypothetical protein n=1 Tax=uncultured Clostridium sp. TaxID=59620 RepID=UPI002626AABC|nr:hypothetical protein [uncultured Clostridium sp.]
MSILDIYEEYKKINKEYVEYNEKLLESKFTDNTDKSIIDNLNKFKEEFESLKIKSDTLEVNEDSETNIKDLQYLIVDAIFVSYDLINFYTGGYIERFKMRITNYINKARRVENKLI